MKATAEILNAWSEEYDEASVPGSVVLPAARWWDVQEALRQLAALRSKPGSAKDIVAAVCAEHENPHLAAKDKHVLAAFDEVLAALQSQPAAPAAPAPKPVAAPPPAPPPVAAPPQPAPQAKKETESPNV